MITEKRINEIVKNTVNEYLNKREKLTESSINRISNYVQNYECAILTAWRGTYTDVTDNTFKPMHITHNSMKTDDGRTIGRGNKVTTNEPINVGDNFSTEEKKFYNRELKASLLKLGYGVTQVRGSYKEFGQNESQEESLFVVNLKDDPNFYKNIFKLSEYYNQDSFMYSPKGSDEGILIGTNNADFPGYGNTIKNGNFKRGIQSLFMSRIGNKGFSFTNGDKVTKDDPNRGDKLNDYEKNNYETDEPLSFADRKNMRMNESIEKILMIETYDKYSIGAKQAISHYCPNLKKIL